MELAKKRWTQIKVERESVIYIYIYIYIYRERERERERGGGGRKAEIQRLHQNCVVKAIDSYR